MTKAKKTVIQPRGSNAGGRKAGSHEQIGGAARKAVTATGSDLLSAVGHAGRKRDLAKPHSVRMDDRTRDLIDAAAEISGQTRTEFMLSSARQQAMAVLLDQRLFRLNDTDWASFQRALDEPAAPNEELKALMARKPAWEQ